MSYDESIYEGNDDDIFASSQSSDSSPDISLNGAHVPGYLRSALERYIRENPQIKESFTKFTDKDPTLKFISVFNLFAKILQTNKPEPDLGPAARTILHLLDESTEGAAQRCYTAFSLEPILITNHMNLTLVTDIFQAINESDHPPCKESEMFLEYLSSLSEILIFSIKHCAEKYTTACELAGLQPDTSLIEYGVKEESDFAFSLSHFTTQILAHYKYGQISEATSLIESSSRKAFVRFLLPLIFSSEQLASDVISEYST